MPAQVSLNSVVGLSSPKTMKLKGVIHNQEVLVMIDPGATHNFISARIVESLGIPVTANKGFDVTLGNGEAIKGTGECRGVVLQMGNIDVVKDFLPFALGNSDYSRGTVVGKAWISDDKLETPGDEIQGGSKNNFD